jgi:serpin B
MKKNQNWKKRAGNLALAGAFLAVLAVGAACGGANGAMSDSTRNLMDEVEAGQENNKLEIDGTEISQEAFAESYCNFSVELLKQNCQSGENVLISPLSVAAALSLAANGAGGDTLAQMEQTLANGTSIDSWNLMLADFMYGLPDEKGAHLSVADSIWFRQKEGFLVKEDFLKKNKETFRADVYEAPFDEQTLRDINQWTSENTDGMIPEILDQIPKDAMLYLINAVAFEAEWKNVYEEYQISQNREFTKSDKTVQSVEMMYARESSYLEDAHATGFIKPYVSGYSFAVLLPEDGMTVSDYVSQMTGEELLDVLTHPNGCQVETGIPSFEVSYAAELSEGLKNMGMEDAFDEKRADFSPMAEFSEQRNLFISRVLHKTFIKVDAKGTKAGAATAVELMDAGAATAEEIRVVICNRPFVYAIIEQESGLPVFIGVLEQVD